MFEMIPAIDLIGGKCVRLTEGRYDTEKVYSDDPVEMARLFEGEGARRLHVVDLEAARDGKATNWKTVEKMASALSIPVELGGGIRTLEAVQSVLELGVQWAIIGSAACKNPPLVREAAEKWGQQIIVGLDARDGFVATEGWTETSKTSATSLAKQFEKLKIGAIVYTDIARDGKLQGPNIQAVQELAASVSLPVIASGGVSQLDDLIQLRELSEKSPTVMGVIVGKAIYEGKFTVAQAMGALRTNS